MAKNKGFIIAGILGTILAIYGWYKLKPKTKSATATEPDTSSGGGGGGGSLKPEEAIIAPPVETIVTPTVITVPVIVPMGTPLLKIPPINITHPHINIPPVSKTPVPILRTPVNPTIKPILTKKPSEHTKFSGTDKDDEFAIALNRTL